MISHPIGMMRMDHDDHLINLRKLQVLMNGLKPSEGSCGS
jgi:iron-sulfur cluster repair protein YtfE (RIC family)